MRQTIGKCLVAKLLITSFTTGHYHLDTWYLIDFEFRSTGIQEFVQNKIGSVFGPFPKL